jgi:hypothetical protein
MKENFQEVGVKIIPALPVAYVGRWVMLLYGKGKNV